MVDARAVGAGSHSISGISARELFYDVIVLKMAMEGQLQWKVEILRQLRLRNQRETSGFTELILSCEYILQEKYVNHGITMPHTCIHVFKLLWADLHVPVVMLPTLSVCPTDGKLQEQVESQRKEILRLEYQKNELDKVGTVHVCAEDARMYATPFDLRTNVL